MLLQSDRFNVVAFHVRPNSAIGKALVERRWGVPLIDGGTVRLPRIVGQGRALEIILTGRKVPAEECLNIGLCEYVTPKGRARAKAEELAKEIARVGTIPELSSRLPWQSLD